MTDQTDFGLSGLPSEAAATIRQRLGLAEADPIRISFVPGPGDVSGTYAAWAEGRHDPRVPVITYSAQFFELVERLGAEAQIVTTYPPPALPEPALPEAETPDRAAHLAGRGARFRFHQVPKRAPATGRRAWAAAEAAYAAAILAAVAAFDPQVVLVSTDMPSAAWAALKGPGGRRLVLTAHNTFWPMGRSPRGPKGIWRRLRLTARARALDDAVCTSGECARQIAAVTGGRVQGLVEHPQVVARYTPKVVGRIRKLLFLGRIESNKGIFLLLDAAAALVPRFPDLELVFAGSGGAAAELEARIAALGQPGLRFVGRLGSDAVHAAIDAADLVVCPTTSAFNEGLAVVGFEAAAHGVPTLMSSVVPAAETLGAAGRVFEADSQPALRDALAALLEDPEAGARMGAALTELRAALYDRDRSWGMQLARVLQRL
ncbi:MAG: glycosyltransferase family 4 protein [Defluviimonas sp.]|nr:glycosyltransferase family 4 protein [Defluviimonas sp.]